MILTFDILTSKSNHLTFVPDYSEAVNLVDSQSSLQEITFTYF